MAQLTGEEILAIDRNHIWHPYASIDPSTPLYPVAAAEGVELVLADGRRLIDGMASWWSAIHGYNHPQLNDALSQQTQKMAHVMFGGLTHEPAALLAKQLVDLTPAHLNRVFFADSGSVSVEVAIKMAIQYWLAQQKPDKHRLLSLRNGYHGDTIGAMSVCDPVTGMHHMFADLLPQSLFVEAPTCGFSDSLEAHHTAQLEHTLATHHQQLAALILEPIVQGTGGMRFYSPEYLRRVRQLCDEYDVLLIADEIATGFGRTGRWFACEHAGISPDILCLGKALTGGYLTLAATLCSDKIAEGICTGEAGVFMHGPTFMANPLACAVANASIELLQSTPWQPRVAAMEQQLRAGLNPCKTLSNVADVRVLGAIGVVELAEPVEMNSIVSQFVDQGIWVRPFGKLVYVMPPYIITEAQLEQLTDGIYAVLSRLT